MSVFQIRKMADISVLDSITHLRPEHAHSVTIAGSHGGLYPAYLAARGQVRGVIFSDAGVGLEGAGIGGLAFLHAAGVAAAVVDYRTARIGDGADMQARGIVSHVNDAAARLGCRAGEPAKLCAQKMRAGPLPSWPVFAPSEGRMLFDAGGVRIWGVDSISLALPDDKGAIIVSGSHGGLLGGRAESAIGPDVLAAAFNDAGVGIDGAGVSRLAALDRRAIAAVTVSAMSARIGDARSSWETGVISAVNATAAGHGLRVGARLSAALTALASTRHGMRAPFRD